MIEQPNTYEHDYSAPLVLDQKQELQIAAIASELGISKERAITEALGVLHEAIDRDIYGGAWRGHGETRLELIEALSGTYGLRIRNNAKALANGAVEPIE